MTSRPWASAPRKKCASHVGPIGRPSRPTTGTAFPPTSTFSVTCVSCGEVSATRWAHSGAASDAATIASSTASDASAPRSRRSRPVAPTPHPP